MRAPNEPNDRAFLEGVVASLPSLRPFAVSLTRSVEQAEDLVQETVLKAISKQEQFEAGTNLQSWLFTIMRNLFCSVYRRAKHEVEDADGSYAAALISVPDHEDRLMLRDLAVALARLPQEQREAILLVGVKGMTYADAAQALECAVGTIQSRVNRARNRLAELMCLDRTGRRCQETARARNVLCESDIEAKSVNLQDPRNRASRLTRPFRLICPLP